MATTTTQSSSTMKNKSTTAATAAKRKKRAGAHKVAKGHAYINASFNNTIVSITDENGATITWASAGTSGFKGSRKARRSHLKPRPKKQAPRQRILASKKSTFLSKVPGMGAKTLSARYKPRVWKLPL